RIVHARRHFDGLRAITPITLAPSHCAVIDRRRDVITGISPCFRDRVIAHRHDVLSAVASVAFAPGRDTVSDGGNYSGAAVAAGLNEGDTITGDIPGAVTAVR